MVVTEFMEGFYSVYELGDHEVDCSLVDDGRTCQYQTTETWSQLFGQGLLMFYPDQGGGP